ncbi:hypothetical protein [Streptomyces litmocidini]|uniref:hypothetical protein n=1 Tax=Streptomyces litmocidini TaxID=67318 RepID=UPI00167E13F6|nr:hypothetical protein [Streptomyces litmocidini]
MVLGASVAAAFLAIVRAPCGATALAVCAVALAGERLRATRESHDVVRTASA